MPSNGADAAPKFPLGNIVATPGVLAEVPRDEIDFALALHRSGSWGDLDPPDKVRNGAALADEGRPRLRLLTRLESSVLRHHGVGPVIHDHPLALGILGSSASPC
jgi:hypothetical protein